MSRPSKSDITHLTKPVLCPKCGYTATAIGTVDGSAHAPEQGDLTMCLNCGAPLAFNADMTMREPTQVEIDAVREEDPDEYRRWVERRKFIVLRGPIPGAVQRGPRA